MNEVIISWIRTGVMLGVGFVVSYALRHGLDVGDNQAEVATWLTAVVTGGYYVVARALEKKWPPFGILLGIPKAPGYDTTAGNVAVAPAPTTDTATPAGAHFANG